MSNGEHCRFSLKTRPNHLSSSEYEMLNPDNQSTPIAHLNRLFDYAGLFPPAGLSMQETVANFHRYHNQPLGWMLNTVVLPAGRLEEFAEATLLQIDSQPMPAQTLPSRLSVLSSDWQQDQKLVEQFDEQHSSLGKVVSVETRQLTDAARIAKSISRVYVEVSITDDMGSQIEAIKQTGALAKIRMGGLTAEAFPSSQQVATFLIACAQNDVSFKATAGLHHPLAKMRPTSTADNAPLASMHGFINMMAAVSEAEKNGSPQAVENLLSLQESEARTKFETVDFSSIASTVRQRFHSIGSCSFTEPVEDLTELDWLSESKS